MPRLILMREPSILKELERSFLGRHEFDLIPSTDGPDLLARAGGQGADLVIAPADMIEPTGADLCTALRNAAPRPVPVLMTGSPHARESALAAGAQGFLPVPWTRSQLLGAIRTFFQQEERASGRAAVSLKVVCGQGTESYVAFTKDISATGVFLKGASLATPGSRLRLRLRLPTEKGEEEVDLMGEVVRRVPPESAARRGTGVGIRFLDFPMAKKIPIARFVRENGGD